MARAAGWQEADPRERSLVRGPADSLQAPVSRAGVPGPGEWPRGQVASGSLNHQAPRAHLPEHEPELGSRGVAAPPSGQRGVGSPRSSPAPRPTSAIS